MVGRDISPLFFPFDHFTYKLRLSLTHGQTFTLVLWFCPAFRYILWDSNASVNSSSAHSPRANPRALAFFFKNGKFPGVGINKSVKCSGLGPKKKANAPHPGSSRKQHCSRFNKI